MKKIILGCLFFWSSLSWCYYPNNFSGDILEHEVSYCGQIADLDRVIKSGGDLEIQDDKQRTPLIYAIGGFFGPWSDQAFGKIMLLLAAGANKQAKDNRGSTPMVYAWCEYPAAAALMSLVESGDLDMCK